MPQIEVSIPDQIDSELNRLVEQGEFINRDQAIEELLSRGSPHIPVAMKPHPS